MEAQSQSQSQDGGVTRVKSNGDGTGAGNSSNNELELLRERDYPFYKPAAGVGSSTAGTSTPGGGPANGAGGSDAGGSNTRGHEVITNKEPSTIQAPTASERERAGYFGGGPSKGSNGTGGTGQGTFRHSQPYTRPSYSTNAGVATPSTSFGYSPAPPTTTDSSEANSEVDEYERDRERDHEGERLAAPSVTAAAESSSVVAPSPDWLPSPVVEETEDDLLSRQASRNVVSNVAAQQPSAAATASTASSTTAKAAQDESLAAHMDALAMEGIQVVPSTSAPAPLQATAPVPASSTAKPVEAAASVPKEALSTGAGVTPARQGSTATIMLQRPAAPEHKKSILGKLFGGHKDKDKHADHSNTSSAAGSPHPTMTGDTARPGLATTGKATTTRGRAGSSTGTRTPSASGAESDTSASTAPTTAAGSTSGSTVKDKDHSALANLLHRRMSNKKMPQPDPSLIAMANASKAGHNVPAGQSPGASNATLSAGGYLNASSTVASRGSTPDVTGVPPPSVSVNRGANPSPARSGTGTPAESAGGRPMMRRPSGSAAGAEGGKADRTYTPTGEQHQVKEKSLKEHLAALGNASSMMGKLNRKTSQTSKRSDDGRSERSGGGGHFYQEDPDHHHPPAPKRAPSVGGQSNASTSLAQKYGICEKVAIGKGATAVVKLAHKWDRSTEKLYAVKEFRKRRKNESEKEYVKKLTSEFCISSTLHHINVVETVDLVQNEEKHWCEVMEYCPGGDLYSAIKKGTMTTEDINIYFKQIVTGVAYLHSMGVAHRDIKPENLLLDNLGHIKITDFGVSDVFRMCWEKQTHMSKGLCGSEPYIAPEQFEQKEYDARLVDVWACAVVFYCMQAQELPWRVAKPSDPSFASYLHNFPSSVVPPPLGNLHPKDCRAVVKKMLNPNPKERIGMEEVLADPFMKGIDYAVPPTHPLPMP